MDDLFDDLITQYPNYDIPNNIFERVYCAAKLNHPKALIAVLNDMPDRAVCNYILNVVFLEKDGQRITPLGMAVKFGHLNFIRTVLFKYDIDLESECDVMFDGLFVHGATALWIAAGMGHLNIVKFLVKRGASINHNTRANSSPLRAACYEGHLDIVKFLIEHGADVNLANSFNNTCIMIASYKGQLDVVDTLLKNGADPNEQALCGATALHYAAECDHVYVCQLLLDHGAVFQKNEHGLTPALHAAERALENVVDMFIKEPNLMSREEKIKTLELIGASFANDKDNYDIDKSFKYLMAAMELRYLDNEPVIKKCVIPPIPAYDNWNETETIQDLRAIRLNHHSIHMESLTIRERILGKNYPQLSHSIVYRGAILADHQRFDLCCTLWNYAVDLRLSNNFPVDRDLSRFVQLFSQMIRIDANLDVSIPLTVLLKCQQAIENNRQIIKSKPSEDQANSIVDELDNNMATVLNLLKIFTILICNKGVTVEKSHKDQLHSLISYFIATNTRFRDGQTLLHRAVDGITPIEDLYTNEICRFPCYKTALLLVHAGALINAEDNERNTPLHVLISTVRTENTIVLNQVEKIIELFVTTGAHLDAVNIEGQTAAHVAPFATLSDLLLKYENKMICLKCIAARTVAFYKIGYKNLIPKTLEEFMRMHTTNKKV